MTRLIDSPFLMLVLSFLILWACAWTGAKILGRYAREARMPARICAPCWRRA
jgi:hypothetical protein